MKNTLIPTALCLVCAAAGAQTSSSVELYGLLDGGLQNVSGLRGGGRTQLVSGIMEGSRIGLRGNEDLSGGVRALFTLENRTELNNGTVSNRPLSGGQLPDRLSDATLMGLPTALQPAVTGVGSLLAQQAFGVNIRNGFWDRQAYVGLVTQAGAFLLGRQYTPAYQVFAAFEPMRTQSSLSTGQVAAFPPSVDIRVDNALQFIVEAAGFRTSIMTTFDGGTSARINRFQGVQSSYQGNGFSVGAGFNRHNNELGETALKSTIVGANVDVGPGRISAVFGTVKDDHPTGLSTIGAALQGAPFNVPAPQASLVQSAFVEGFKQDARIVGLGYTLTTGPVATTVAYSKYDDRRPANADVASYGVASTYSLSKRTDVNLVLTRFNNTGLAQAAPGQAGFLGGVTAAAGTDSTSIALGLRHHF